jgi:peptidoglycan/LPS O-acetylase OafA/YrhL
MNQILRAGDAGEVLEDVEPRRLVEPMKGHVPTLDGLRGLAILLVLLIHFCCASGGEPRTRLDHLFYNLAYSGWCGVDLFFLLSGFLITGILVDTRSSSRRIRNFYARRTLRIFPLYYGALILWFLVLPAVAPGWTSPGLPRRKQLWAWLYATNWALAWQPDSFGNLDHFWSLAIEEHFYLVWPFVVWSCSRLTAVKVCIACFCASTLSRILLVALGVAPGSVWQLDTSHTDSLCLGGLIALLVRGPSGSAPLVEPAKKIAIIALIALASVIFWRGRMSHMDGAFLMVGVPPLLILFGAGIVLVAHAPPSSLLGLIFNSGVMKFFGKYSYGLYVWHWLLSPWYRSMFPTERIQASFGRFIPAAVCHATLGTAVTVFIALLSYHLYEVRFINAKRFFESPPTSAPGCEARPQA